MPPRSPAPASPVPAAARGNPAARSALLPLACDRPKRSSSAPHVVGETPTPILATPRRSPSAQRLTRADSDTPKQAPRVESPNDRQLLARGENSRKNSPSPVRRVIEAGAQKTGQVLAAVFGTKPRVKASFLKWLDEALKPKPRCAKSEGK